MTDTASPAASTAGGQMLGGPLAGLRVLDLTRLLPGPVASMHLADMGAEVIKIEDTGAGDYARTMGARMPSDAESDPGNATDSIFFRMVNRNKRALRLDLKQSMGVDVFLRLARDADIIIESFRPGVVDKLGIGYEAVKAINPRVVYAAITGYGQTGPWADKAGHDLNFIATAGVLDQIGACDEHGSGPPAIPNLQIGDLLGGALTPLFGILAAVIGARTTGQGSYVDVAMTDAVLAHTIFPLVTMLARGKPAPRGTDLLTGGVPCYAVYRTSDARYLAVGALEPKFWNTFCHVIGRPDMTDLGLTTGDEGARVRAELSRQIAAQPLSYWQDILADTDCCVTPVLTLDEALDHPQIRAREMSFELGGVRQYALPVKFSAWGDKVVHPSAHPVMHPAPASGADTQSILSELGYDAMQIEQMRENRVI